MGLSRHRGDDRLQEGEEEERGVDRNEMKILVTLMLLAAAQLSRPAPTEVVKRLAARVPVVAVEVATPLDLAGRYTGQTRELRSRVGPFLSGEDLYLFPDGTYLYCEWGDIVPKTIYDKGKWVARNGTVEFVSDADIAWEPGFDRRHVLVRRTSHQREIILLAVPADIDYFEKNAADDPELMLLIVGMSRVETFSEKTSSGLKARLMRDAWDPKHFRKR